MAKTKSDVQKKGRVLTKARDFYMCGCDGEVVNSTVPQTSRKSSKDGNEDLHGLMQLLSMRQGGGATVDVDSDGNLVWRKPASEMSYGGGVGRIGRIDEDKPCCFNQVDLNKFKCLKDVHANTRNLVYI